jgi:hypothetical protein
MENPKNTLKLAYYARKTEKSERKLYKNGRSVPALPGLLDWRE